MSPVRKWAAALAALQMIAGSTAVADLVAPKWVALFIVLVGGAQAFLSAYQQPPRAPRKPPVMAQSTPPEPKPLP